MKLQLKELFEIIGEVREFDFDIPKKELDEYGSYVFETPVKVKGFVENRAGVVTLRYSVSFSMLLTCDRCLNEFVREFEFSFEHIVMYIVICFQFFTGYSLYSRVGVCWCIVFYNIPNISSFCYY